MENSKSYQTENHIIEKRYREWSTNGNQDTFEELKELEYIQWGSRNINVAKNAIDNSVNNSQNASDRNDCQFNDAYIREWYSVNIEDNLQETTSTKDGYSVYTEQEVKLFLVEMKFSKTT